MNIIFELDTNVLRLLDSDLLFMSSYRIHCPFSLLFRVLLIFFLSSLVEEELGVVLWRSLCSYRLCTVHNNGLELSSGLL